MAINSIQIRTNNNNLLAFKKENKQESSYLNAKKPVNTDNKVHPLPPNGYLIDDSFIESVKFFFKDRTYDLKSVKNGLNGSANDHQLGRLNDIGLVTAGILIATYLASKTPNKNARIMEYIGLGTFLTAMSIYPKLFINTPAKLIHGFDVDKKYIDDQGRKKSVMQDSNYVPYDMYLGKVSDENIAKIGDKMGIPRDIKNRNNVIQEQMRKISTQNNTLWMLTAGITPAIAALLSCGIEKLVVAPLLEKSNIAKLDSQITKALEQTSKMDLNIESISENPLSKSINELLGKFKGKELPKEEFNNIIKILSTDLHENTEEGIARDLTNIFKASGNNSKTIFLKDKAIDEILVAVDKSISSRNKKVLQELLLPTKEEINSILKKYISTDSNLANGTTIDINNLSKIREDFLRLIDARIDTATDIPKNFLNFERDKMINKIISELDNRKSVIVSDDIITKVTNFAKILGDFNKNQKILQKCNVNAFEYTNETLIANSYNKFEQTLLKELNIKLSDLKKMKESEAYSFEILDKKFEELAKNEAKFKKVMKSLGKVISDFEVNLHGTNETNSRMLNLINAIENNYNNTAKRIAKLGGFEETVIRLVNQDVNTLDNNLKSKEELFDFLDGIIPNRYTLMKDFNSLSEAERIEYIEYNYNGAGSSKRLEISRILERYQGAKNSFNRIIHTLDVYKRAVVPEEYCSLLEGKDKKYIEQIINKAKISLLSATSSDFIMKLDTVDNPDFYIDLMNSTWVSEGGDFYSTKQKGFVSNSTKEILNSYNSKSKGAILDRFQYYITRFRNLVGNNTNDFTKPHHILNPYIQNSYKQQERTRVALFNLIGQNPVELAMGGAGRRFATQKWLRIISAITASVCGATISAQFLFGKLNNPHKLVKQVNNDANN